MASVIQHALLLCTFLVIFYEEYTLSTFLLRFFLVLRRALVQYLGVTAGIEPAQHSSGYLVLRLSQYSLHLPAVLFDAQLYYVCIQCSLKKSPTYSAGRIN
jgi:hypothetical protein